MKKKFTKFTTLQIYKFYKFSQNFPQNLQIFEKKNNRRKMKMKMKMKMNGRMNDVMVNDVMVKDSMIEKKILSHKFTFSPKFTNVTNFTTTEKKNN
jgi:hypothetical protein